MAPQRKTSRDKKQADPINWTKVGAISIAVLFAVMMAASLLGTAWIGGIRTVQPGDLVVIDYTIYNENDIPVLTTLEVVASQAGGFVYLTGPIEVSAGYQHQDTIIGIPDRHSRIPPFALLKPEFESITQASIGYRERDRITVPLIKTSDTPLVMEMSAEEFEKLDQSFVFDDVTVGDMIMLGFTDSPDIMMDEGESQSMLRTFTVQEKTDEAMLLSYSYSYAVVTINSVTAIS